MIIVPFEIFATVAYISVPVQVPPVMLILPLPWLRIPLPLEHVPEPPDIFIVPVLVLYIIWLLLDENVPPDIFTIPILAFATA